MDRNAAKDYFVLVLNKIEEANRGKANVVWVLILGVAGYFAFKTAEGVLFAALIGYGLCAILSRLDRIRSELWQIEFQRHLHEHTDVAEEGQMSFKSKKTFDEAVSQKWWKS